MKQMIFLVHQLHQYRVDFYHLLRTELAKDDINLLLIYSKSKDNAKKDEVDIEWGHYVPVKSFKILGIEFIWQPVLDFVKKSDLIVVQQANRLLLNYFLILFRRFYKIKMAYWGHGLNMQLPQDSFANKFKKMLISRTDWWFAYTSKVKETVVSSGFPEEKVTVVNNAIDTKKLTYVYNQLNGKEVSRIKEDLKMQTENVGIYCGGIYEEKRIKFLIEASDLIRKEVNDFELIIIGSGPDEKILKKMMKTRDYIHFVGPKFHDERVPYFKLSKVMLMPGLVGLGILDSFALETPMATTNFPYHSPEIGYLENNVNGIMTDNNVKAYAKEVIKLFKDQLTLNKLVEGCKATAPLYNNERMVQNFKAGVVKCLKEA